jgi:hypothetical protein
MNKENQNTTDFPDTISADMLRGAKGIASFLGITPRKVYYLVGRQELPVFRLGNQLCARRSTLLRHLNALEKLDSLISKQEAANHE